MDPRCVQLEIDVAVLKTQLSTALREKATAEQSLLHMLKVLSLQPQSYPNLTPSSGSPTLHDSKNGIEDVAEQHNSSITQNESAVHATQTDLLDEPPKLDLEFRGARTSHDEHPEPPSSLRSDIPSTQACSFASETSVFAKNEALTRQAQTFPPPGRPRGIRAPVRRGFQETSTYNLYGIHYEPLNAPPKTFHRVLITGLPSGLLVSSLLSKIHGGTIVSCQLLDTTGLTGCGTALVRFKDEAQSLGFSIDTQKNPLSFQSQKATTTLIKTPTYPLPNKLHYNIFFNNFTRCLQVKNYTQLYTRMTPPSLLRSKFMAHITVNLMMVSPEGELVMHFISIELASDARDYLLYERGVQMNDISFLPDPCAASGEGATGQSRVWKAEEILDLGGGLLDAEAQGEDLQEGFEGTEKGFQDDLAGSLLLDP